MEPSSDFTIELSAPSAVSNQAFSTSSADVFLPSSSFSQLISPIFPQSSSTTPDELDPSTTISIEFSSDGKPLSTDNQTGDAVKPQILVTVPQLDDEEPSPQASNGTDTSTTNPNIQIFPNPSPPASSQSDGELDPLAISLDGLAPGTGLETDASDSDPSTSSANSSGAAGQTEAEPPIIVSPADDNKSTASPSQGTAGTVPSNPAPPSSVSSSAQEAELPPFDSQSSTPPSDPGNPGSAVQDDSTATTSGQPAPQVPGASPAESADGRTGANGAGKGDGLPGGGDAEKGTADGGGQNREESSNATQDDGRQIPGVINPPADGRIQSTAETNPPASGGTEGTTEINPPGGGGTQDTGGTSPQAGGRTQGTVETNPPEGDGSKNTGDANLRGPGESQDTEKSNPQAGSGTQGTSETDSQGSGGSQSIGDTNPPEGDGSQDTAGKGPPGTGSQNLGDGGTNPSQSSQSAVPDLPDVGQPLSGSQDQSSGKISGNGGDRSGKPSTKIAGVASATSLVTSSVTSQSPTATVAGGNSPPAAVTKETPGFLTTISNSFNDPATRTKSIGILVGAVAGFLLIVALIIFLCCFMRRKKQKKQEEEVEGGSGPGENKKGELEISAPFNQSTQAEIANYDPSAELMADSNGLERDPSQPSQLDNALVNRASMLSASRKSYLDIYGGANTPYPQDVVDGSGRPLTQQFLMPNSDKFQDYQQNDTSAEPVVDNLPHNTDPADPPTDQTLSSDPFNPNPSSDETVAAVAPLAAAKAGTTEEQPRSRRKPPRPRADSWMTVNTVATTKAPPPSAGGRSGRKPSHTDYNSVYMRNPFIEEDQAASGAPPVPAMPAIPKHFQEHKGQARSNRQQIESVTLMFSPSANQPRSQNALQRASGPEDTDDVYGGILDDYPSRPPSAQFVPGRGPDAYGGEGVRRSNPFDLEDDGGAQPGSNNFRDDKTVKSVQSWLSGVADAERDRRNVI